MAARVFEQQSTPPTFTCSLQANFLRNVVQEYKRACRRPVPRSTTDQGYYSPLYEQDMRVSTRVGPNDAMISDNTRNLVQPGLAFEESRFRTVHAYEKEDFSSNRRDVSVNDFSEHMPSMVPVSNDAPGQESSPSTWDFAGRDWAPLFMSAGFDILDGVFIPG